MNLLNTKKQKHAYCSTECKSLAQRTGRYVFCDNCGEAVYRRGYELKKNDHVFCSVSCEFEFRSRECREQRVCPICGQTFSVRRKIQKTFCSNTCQSIWQTTRIGSLNGKFSQKEIQCEWCKQLFMAPKHRAENGRHHFCSVNCKREWYSKILSQQPAWREANRKTLLYNISRGKYANTNTKPQQIVNSILDGKGIKYIREKAFKYHSVDNYLPEYNLIIEVMGDYWHCNPIKYKEPINKTHITNITRDKAKHTYFKNNENIEILYLWEYDLVNRPKVCEKLIEEYVNTSGKLDDYNSYNYILDDDKNKLNLHYINP